VHAAEVREQARENRRGRGRRPPESGRPLSSDELAEVGKTAGEELRRLGYPP
jgi:hypothetical protein